jgi:AraC-like DNA-binding protein
MAPIVGLSCSQFCRWFKPRFGFTPQAYIRAVRMDLAKHLLMHTDKPICEIALACGLADQPHFTKLFNQLVGDAPGRWRKRMKPI